MTESQDDMASVPPPDVTTMRLLTYVKMMYRQAVAQSETPPPLDSFAVLTFHDACEWLFILAVSHVESGQSIDLRLPFSKNLEKLRAPDGRLMSSRDAISRIASYRDGFKHNGAVPGSDHVEHARRDATQFLESNCPRFFGCEFSDISMLEIVPQEEVREQLKAGRALADDGDIDGGMSHLALAFDQLVTDWGRGKALSGPYNVADFALSRGGWRSDRRIEYHSRPSDSSTQSAVSQIAQSVKRQLEDTDKELEAVRNILRIQMAGIDMARYLRFAMIAPHVSVTLAGERSAYAAMGKFHYKPENYDFCEKFVIDSALTVAQSDFKLWMPRSFGEVTAAEEAMKANGGRLPDDYAGGFS